MFRYHCLTIGSFIGFLFNSGFASGQPYVPGNRENITYADTFVHRIDILIEADSLNRMYSQLNDHEYPATAFINHRNGVDTIFDIGISLRGNTSLYADKKSFKISFNTFVPGRKYKKLEKLNLNGEHNDPAISRAKFYWETLESMRVPGPRANHYEVWINGNYYGLYLNVEHIDENFIESRFDNDGGNLYKCLYPADLSFIGQDPNLYKFTSNGRRTYELQTNLQADDYSDLERLIDQLNNNNGSTFKDSLEELLNVNSFLRAYAVDIATGHWDDYAFNMNNYYLYRNNETGKFEFIPYDADNTFGIDWSGISWKTRDIYNWQGGGNRPLVTKLLSQSEYRNRFSFFMNQLMQRMGNPAIAFPMIDSVRSMIAPFALNDAWRTLDYGFTYSDFYNSFDQALGGHVREGIKAFIGTRNVSTTSQLQLNQVPPIFSETRHIPRFPIFGDSIFIRTWIEDEATIQNAVLTYRWNAGQILTAPLSDDGQHRDNLANDAYFGAFAGTATTGDTLYYYIQHTDPTGRTGREPRNGWKQVIIKGIPYLRINEWCSSNTTLIPDEAGEFDDWIELYNPLPNNQSWERIHLSDTIGNPGKWRMPDTTVGGNGFILLWADEDGMQGPMHMNFKLSSTSGESIIVSYFNGDTYRILDSVVFGPMSTDQSLGCIPDGVRPVVWQQPPSPGSSNLVTDLDAPDKPSKLSIYPNPARDYFLVKSTTAYHVIITDISGNLILENDYESGIPIPLEGFSSGIYLCSISLSENATEHLRLLVQK